MSGYELQNKAAIVTGGAQGLGQAISQRLAREGCRVLIADVNEAGVKPPPPPSPKKPASASSA